MNSKKIKEQIRDYRFEYGVTPKTSCTKEENEEYTQFLKDGKDLPKGVYQFEDAYGGKPEFYTINEPEITNEELQEFLTYKKLGLLSTIKNCCVFFVVLTIISLVGSFIFALIFGN